MWVDVEGSCTEVRRWQKEEVLNIPLMSSFREKICTWSTVGGGGWLLLLIRDGATLDRKLYAGGLSSIFTELSMAIAL